MRTAGKVQQTVHVQGYTLTLSSTYGESYSRAMGQRKRID